MKLPNLSSPVASPRNSQFANRGVQPSDWKCTACCTACSILSGPAKAACQLACKLTLGCSC